MSAIGHAPPPFFKRGPAPLVRLFFFVSVSVVLLIADLRFHTLEWARLTIATIMWPLQRAAWLPIHAVDDIGHYFVQQSELQKENTALRQQRIEATQLLLRQRHLEDENQRLRALLDMRMRQPVNGQIAEIIYAARDPFSRRVIIDKGLQQGIQSGQAVVDERGVIGQVIRSFPLTAEVSLLTDRNQAIPVQVQRNGLRSVLSGAGGDRMELHFLARNADVQIGDILVTSGLDGVYLAGLPVAKVVRIDRDNAYAFARISCAPVAGIENHGLVLILALRPPLLLPQSEVLVPEKSRRGKSRKR